MFMLEEFQCPCKRKSCEGKLPQLQSNLRPQLIQALNRVRTELSSPIIVNSGFRCKEHNEAIKGALASRHLFGDAADIRCKPELMDKLMELVLAEPAFTGVGDGRKPKGGGFIHVDTRPIKPGTPRKQWNYS